MNTILSRDLTFIENPQMEKSASCSEILLLNIGFLDEHGNVFLIKKIVYRIIGEYTRFNV